MFPAPEASVVGPPPWWKAQQSQLLELAATQGTPLYVYDAQTLAGAVDRLKAIEAVDRILFAMKANPHPEILAQFAAAGLGFECVSPGEIERVFDVVPDLDPARVLFTPNFCAREELEQAFSRGVAVTIDNLHPLERWPEIFSDRSIFLRLDPGEGRGHHRHVHTGGTASKFGIPATELDRLAQAVVQCGVRVVGLHAHIGSGIHTAENWADIGLFLAEAARRFPHVRVLDLGGGLGVPERPGHAALDLSALGESLRRLRLAHPQFSLWLEPGRYLVAEAGVLLTRVTQLKEKGAHRYVGVDAGMNSLIRPALYGAHHDIVNLTQLEAPLTLTASVVGPICESGDVLGFSRRLPATEEGDVLLVATTGAYGHSMASNYNLRSPAQERYCTMTPDCVTASRIT
jgi:diaminopimelate decarboxylase/aspartate kinase